MPTLPARLAATAERWFGHPAVVTAVEDLSPGLRRVVFTGDALRGRRWTPGQEVEFRVADREFRHYTPTVVDPDAGVVEVLFADHGDGPGAAWARALAPGDDVGVMGPAGGIRGRITDRRLLLGDASTLGLFACFAAFGHGAVLGAVEVPAGDVEAAAALVPDLHVLPAAADPGVALHEWTISHYVADPRRDQAYLVGHAQTIQALRTQLRAQGMPRAAITTKPYWATGRTGL